MVKQTDAFQGSGIAADMFKKLFEFLEGGNGIQDHIVTTGLGANQAILSDVDRIVPSITIMNQGPSPILIGYGNPTAVMQAGDDLTLNWCNPAKRRLMINDQKVAGIVIDILG